MKQQYLVKQANAEGEMEGSTFGIIVFDDNEGSMSYVVDASERDEIPYKKSSLERIVNCYHGAIEGLLDEDPVSQNQRSYKESFYSIMRALAPIYTMTEISM